MNYFNHTIHNCLDSLKKDPNGLSFIHIAQQSIVLKGLLTGWHALHGVEFEVGSIKNEGVTLFVANPSALSRIKQSLPSLLQQLRQNGWLIQKINLKVTSLPGSNLPKSRNRNNKRIPKLGLEAFKALEQQIDNEEIFAAIQKLNRHHHSDPG